MTEVQRLNDQLHRALYGEAWHGPSVMELLEGVSADQAVAKPLESAHSIRELVLHITAWKRSVYERLTGEPGEVLDEEDFPIIADSSKAAWQETISMLKEVHRKLEEEVLMLSDVGLGQNLAGRDYTPYFLVHGVIQHDLYHAGQIAVLKKLV
jgi:uncharacterized damage-inducible protein DinB